MTQNTKDYFWDTNLGDLDGAITPKPSQMDHLQKLMFGEIFSTMGHNHQQGEIYSPGILSMRRLAYNQIKGIIHHDPRVPYSYRDINQ